MMIAAAAAAAVTRVDQLGRQLGGRPAQFCGYVSHLFMITSSCHVYSTYHPQSDVEGSEQRSKKMIALRLPQQSFCIMNRK